MASLIPELFDKQAPRTLEDGTRIDCLADADYEAAGEKAPEIDGAALRKAIEGEMKS